MCLVIAKGNLKYIFVNWLCKTTTHNIFWCINAIFFRFSIKFGITWCITWLYLTKIKFWPFLPQAKMGQFGFDPEKKVDHRKQSSNIHIRLSSQNSYQFIEIIKLYNSSPKIKNIVIFSSKTIFLYFGKWNFFSSELSEHKKIKKSLWKTLLYLRKWNFRAPKNLTKLFCTLNKTFLCS